MFTHGAEAYIEDLAELIPLTDGSIRTALDTGCGVRGLRYRSFHGTESCTTCPVCEGERQVYSTLTGRVIQGGGLSHPPTLK